MVTEVTVQAFDSRTTELSKQRQDIYVFEFADRKKSEAKLTLDHDG